MLFNQAIEGFILSRTAEGYSPNTLEMYKWALSLVVSHLGNPDPGNISHREMVAFFAWLQTDYEPTRMSGDTSPLSNRSIENIWTAIRSFYNWYCEEFDLQERPDRKIARPKYPDPIIESFTEEEVKRMMIACDHTKYADTSGRKSFTMRRNTAQRDKAIVLVLLDTGIRVSECARLKVGDVDLATGKMVIVPFGTGRKTAGRMVYLCKRACKFLWKYLQGRGLHTKELTGDDPLFVNRGGNAMDRNSIRRMIVRLGVRSGVQNAHPHCFRHTFAIQYLRNGGDVFTLQRLLGHSSLEMVRHYLRLADADAEEAHRRASPVDGWGL